MSSPFRPPGSRYDPRGFAVGTLMTNVIAATHELELQQWRWRYGTHFRGRPFPPHEGLDGRYMTTFGTLDGYYPGDHKGCLCMIEPVYRRRFDPVPTLD